MVHSTVRKYVMVRGQFIEWEDFKTENVWAQTADVSDLPDNCVSIYYSVDMERHIIKERLCMVTYSPKYQPDFKKISVAWVSEYFSVEPADLFQLDNPEDSIIKPGGEIFCLINSQGTAVGTVAMIVEADGDAELGKMGVLKDYNGKGYAHPLMHEAILWAKRKHFPAVNLHTARKLTPAVTLYQKYGFKEIPFRGHSHFTRVDLVMQLKL
ncbi:hypothetical protein INT47_003655 [Mucor saturninus]|uniref:N-acetyltransferase domain-containing protein n=1 Tax=Mucor saturninus TaxID=64648 RepID=A0A8H7RBK5_9FUNG|nr:hypothetical protein INT47_003655 [Mucor saturninus]